MRPRAIAFPLFIHAATQEREKKVADSKRWIQRRGGGEGGGKDGLGTTGE